MKFLFIAFFGFISGLSIGQTLTSGKVTYKETVKLNLDLGEDRPELAKMFPSSQSVDKVLFFNSKESLFKNNEKPKDLDIKTEEDGNEFQLVMKIPESITYTNQEAGTYVQSQDLMGKEFLISDKLEKKKWKLTGEQKSILDRPCQKALLSDTSQNVVAWFTSQIPVGIGPNGMTGLPGLILALERDNGNIMVIATSIEDLPNEYEFVKPNKGKSVNKEEFGRIRDKKMKEMGMVTGGGSGTKIIIREERN